MSSLCFLAFFFIGQYAYLELWVRALKPSDLPLTTPITNFPASDVGLNISVTLQNGQSSINNHFLP